MIKGKNKFNKNDAEKIRQLIAKKTFSNRQEQKKIRHTLRTKLGFYIEDFTKKKGFTKEDFDNLISTGSIEVY